MIPVVEANSSTDSFIAVESTVKPKIGGFDMTVPKTKYNKSDYHTALTKHSEELIDLGDEPLELQVTRMISNGSSLKAIAISLGFPAVHLLSWLKKEHPELLQSATEVSVDQKVSDILSESNDYDEYNYKHNKAKHDIQLKAINKRIEAVKPPSDVPQEGRSFTINVVMPDYIGAKDVTNNSIPNSQKRPVIEAEANRKSRNDEDTQ